MNSPIDKLYKFLRLEVERGFDDRAVFGGLRNILVSWENEARAAEIPNIVIQAVTARLRDYHQLTPASREEILIGLWKRVQRASEEPVPDLFTDPSGKAAPQTPVRKAVEQVRSAPADAQEPSAAEAPAEAPEDPRMPDADDEDEDEDAQPVEANARDLMDMDEPEEDAAPEPAAAPEPETRSFGKRKYPVPPSLAPEEAAALGAPLTVISGIGPKFAERAAALGLHTLGDALYFFPRRYDDYSMLAPINRLKFGEVATVIGSVERVTVRSIRSGRKLVEALVSDGSGVIRATWFNQPWLAEQLKKAGNVSLSGKIEQYLGRLVLNSPEWEPLETRNLHTQRIVPVYPLTADISQKWLRKKIREVVDYWADRVRDPLPEALLESAELMPVSAALKQIHYPDSWEALDDARHRLAFDELLALQLSMYQQRRKWIAREGRRFVVSDESVEHWLSQLPFKLTSAQQNALGDLRGDLASGRPMNRLLQGDVGSGKTVVAAAAIGIVAVSGAQSAVMAPTAILAEQHFRSLAQLLSGEGGVIPDGAVRLLVGATPESEKQQIREGLASGEIKMVIGTHALLEPDVNFRDLALVVIDEQHRFGVRQRGVLRDKGHNAHLLVMTATPIPRSLALTVYGDLELSVMDEMPPGREPVGTYLLRPIERERVYTLINREVDAGRQAFMIFPLVEESENSESKAAVSEFEQLQEKVFPTLQLGLLHGRMPPDEKEAVMERFRDGETDVLVSTSVVEVGVDVPNATVMVIEGANRFGLAQLHQFRGRVGRGTRKSYCLLVPEADNQVENERLQAMVETNDGFVLAERDLEQRGPGEFLGIQQSGYAGLKLASLTDVRMIEKARQVAGEIFAVDPDLAAPEHEMLKEQIELVRRELEGDVS